MRAIRTFVLRVLFDSTEQQSLRGSVQAVQEAEPHAFADGEKLLALIRQKLNENVESNSEPRGAMLEGKQEQGE